MFRKLFWVAFLALFIVPTLAYLQANDCPQIVQSAFTTTRALCESAGRNQACYGNAQLEVELAADYADQSVNFSRPGDTLDLLALQTLRLSPMDVGAGTWGMSLMRVQANVVDAAQNITLLVFGDVALANAGETAEMVDVIATTNANVRLLPSPRAGVVDVLRQGELGHATGRLADNSWVRVIVSLGEDGALSGTGWVSADLLSSTALDALPVVEAEAQHYQPMQAFTFESSSDAPCAEAPRSGILVQTPEGHARIRLLINGVDVDLGSTAYITAQRGGDMTIALLEGSGAVTSAGVQQPLFPGSQISVALDANLAPSGAPSLPQPYNAQTLSSLPTGLLSESIVVAPALTEEALADLVDEAAGGQGNNGNHGDGNNGNGNNGNNGNSTGNGNNGNNGNSTGNGNNGNGNGNGNNGNGTG
jgi:hypothetical protein